MRHFSFLLIYFIFTLQALNAQAYKTYWSDGKLNWDDFLELESNDNHSGLVFELGYNSDKLLFNDTLIISLKAICFMDNSRSWVHPDFKNDQQLRYLQVIFDLSELYRRKLQTELYNCYPGENAQSRTESMLELCEYKIRTFQEESKFGERLYAIENWEKDINEKLAKSTPSIIPPIEKRNFGYGMHIGTGAGFYRASLGKHFSPGFNLIYGFDIAYKRAILFLNGTLAWSQVKKEYQEWPTGQRTHVALIEASVGYAFIDNSKIKIAAHAGLGITEFSKVVKDDPESSQAMVNYNILVGINSDYKIRKRIKITAGPMKEIVETTIRAKLYVSRAKFSEELNGYSINLTLGICGFGNLIRIIEQK